MGWTIQLRIKDLDLVIGNLMNYPIKDSGRVIVCRRHSVHSAWCIVVDLFVSGKFVHTCARQP